jgi:hypothetical protein
MLVASAFSIVRRASVCSAMVGIQVRLQGLHLQGARATA